MSVAAVSFPQLHMRCDIQATTPLRAAWNFSVLSIKPDVSTADQWRASIKARYLYIAQAILSFALAIFKFLLSLFQGLCLILTQNKKYIDPFIYSVISTGAHAALVSLSITLACMPMHFAVNTALTAYGNRTPSRTSLWDWFTRV